jgi:hypothetical protein
MGIRALARTHGIANHSVVAFQAKARNWVKKRADYREGASEKAVVYMADAEGMRRAKEALVRDHAIEAIDQAIVKLMADMADTVKSVNADGEMIDTGIPIMRIKPGDVAMLIDRLNVLFNRPSSITEERSLGISLSASGVGTDILRGIVEATRGLGQSGAERSPIPRLDRASEN